MIVPICSLLRPGIAYPDHSDGLTTRFPPPVQQERTLCVSCSAAVSSTSGPAHDGGDFAEIFTLPGHFVAMGTWDAAGHGREAAANMMLVRAGLHALMSANASLVTTLGALNRVLFRQAKGAIPWPFVAGFFAVVDTQRRCLQYVSCGHETAILFDAKGGHRHLAHNSPLLGIDDAAKFRDDSVSLTSGDVRVVATNGITDARPLTSEIDFFGSRRICSLFQPPQETVDAPSVISKTVCHSDGDLDDDAAVLIARFVDGPGAGTSSPNSATAGHIDRIGAMRSAREKSARRTSSAARTSQHSRDGGS